MRRGMADNLDAINAVTRIIIAAAIEVHRALGPGLLESAYATCLAHELRGRNLGVVTSQWLPLEYKDVRLDCGYRIDMIVNDVVLLELKSVSGLAPIHEAQLLTYLKLTGCPAGLLINFNVPLLKQGIRRLLNPKPTRFARPTLPEQTNASTSGDGQRPSDAP